MRRGKVLVYIAGPYSTGDPIKNTHEAMKTWYMLWMGGFIPICPHWSMFQHFLTPLPYKSWLEYDRAILRVCDAVLRIPGESAGADEEVRFATYQDIPVFFNEEALYDYFKHES